MAELAPGQEKLPTVIFAGKGLPPVIDAIAAGISPTFMEVVLPVLSRIAFAIDFMALSSILRTAISSPPPLHPEGLPELPPYPEEA